MGILFKNYIVTSLKIIQKWFSSEILRIKKDFDVWIIFWLGIVTFIFSSLLFLFGENVIIFSKDVFLTYPNIFLTYCIAGAFCLVGLLVYIVDPIAQLNIQEIHNEPSWVFYSYWGIINSFLIWSLTLFSNGIIGFWKYGLYISLIIILTKGVNEFFSGKNNLEFKNFASGAVGINKDKLNFSFSAKNVSEGLLKLHNYVNVVGLYGGFGFGKSSYARMILEHLNAKKVLYTYISLTETNEAKDFSKLFAERWLETLSERYPKIDVTAYLPFMDSILRESGNGFLSEILKVISALNHGLVKTKAFFYDEFYSNNKPVFTTEKIAKLFGNITEIKEPLWIIMIDEIDRAQFDEIYRLIEIIERFKNEGRSGLPTKLLFLFCISEPELENYLNSYLNKDPRVNLLKTFFYDDPKSINYRIFLPPVEPLFKERYIIEQLKKITDREEIKVPEDLNPHAISDPSGKFLDHKNAMEYTIAILKESSPRIINRIAGATDFFYGAFKNRAGELQKNSLRFNDILTLEYIKIQYPYLIDFFINTIYILINQAEMHNIDAYFAKQELKEKKLDLIGWIEDVTKVKIEESKKSDVLKMVGLVMYYYFDFLNRDYDTKTKDKYFGTTSYPEIMWDYLSLMADGIETNYRKNERFYQKHKSNPEDLIRNLKNPELISYARFLFDVPNSGIHLNIDLIQELAERITSQNVRYPFLKTLSMRIF